MSNSMKILTGSSSSFLQTYARTEQVLRSFFTLKARLLKPAGMNDKIGEREGA